MSTLILKNDDGKIIAEYDTDNVLWQVLEKEHIAEDMSDKEWSDLVYQNNKCSTFADEASRLGREIVSEYEPTNNED